MKKVVCTCLLVSLLLILPSCGGRFASSGGGAGGSGDPAETASNAITLSLPSMAAAKPGARCTIPLSLNNAATVAGFDVTVIVDSAVLTPVDAELSDMSAGRLVDKTLSPGTIRVVLAGSEAFSQGAGPVVNLVFTVQSGALYGAESPLTLQEATLYTAEAKKCEGVETSDGTFTVNDGDRWVGTDTFSERTRFPAKKCLSPSVPIQASGDPAVPGALKGIVIDRLSGAPIEGAVISCGDAEKALFIAASKTGAGMPGEAWHAISDRHGSFEIPSIPPGTGYSLVARREGYASSVIRRIEILPGAAMARDVEIGLTTGASGPLFQDEAPGRTQEVPMPPSPRERGGDAANACGKATHLVYATREGLVGGTTANGHVITERDHFVALPSRRALCPSDKSTLYRVELTYKGKKITVPVWDIGPWNIKDDYWSPQDQREMWNDLARFLPEAQAAYQNGYNNGRDGYGRIVKNPAGIDLADGVFWDDLAMTDNDWIEVRYLWLESAPALQGDINSDGMVNSQDGQLCLAITVGNSISYPASPAPHAATTSEKQAADMNGDGAVGVDDAILILRQ